MHRFLTRFSIAGVVAGSLALGGGPAAAGAPDATLWVAHGVPGATVEVCVNGSEVKSGFTYMDSFSADLAAGTYDVEVRADAVGTCSGSLILAASPTLKSGKNYTAVAGLSRRGAPELFFFKNNVRPTMTGDARLTVRHTAAAPKVDVRANRSVLLADVRNGDQGTLAATKGTYRVRVNLANTRTTAIGPDRFELMGGRAYQVFAVGNGSEGYDFLALAQRVGTK